MNVIWHDDVSDQIRVATNTRSEDYPPRSLAAAVDPDGQITVRMLETLTNVVKAPWTEFADKQGGGFSDANALVAYLNAEFGKKRSLGFEFVQVQPSLLWVIRHALGFRPGGIALVDTAGDPMTADWRFLDADTVTVTFTSPTAGTAYLS